MPVLSTIYSDDKATLEEISKILFQYNSKIMPIEEVKTPKALNLDWVSVAIIVWEIFTSFKTIVDSVEAIKKIIDFLSKTKSSATVEIVCKNGVRIKLSGVSSKDEATKIVEEFRKLIEKNVTPK